jgi:hypothetical protein
LERCAQSPGLTGKSATPSDRRSTSKICRYLERTTLLGKKKSFPLLYCGWVNLTEQSRVNFVERHSMGRGLLHSFSRGAWLGTAGGIGYLVFQTARQKLKFGKPKAEMKMGKAGCGEPASLCSMRSMRLNMNWLSVSVVLWSVVVLCFWQFRETDWHPARRSFSAVRTEDYSWRNRVAAWEGAWQILAEHPWLGAGWNQPEPLYDHYFLPAKLTESAAIQMNDYLMLGATLGVPALFCFGMYLWLTLKNYDKGFRLWALGSGPRNQSAENEGSSAKSDPSEREGNREMARGKAESVSSFILRKR